MAAEQRSSRDARATAAARPGLELERHAPLEASRSSPDDAGDPTTERVLSHRIERTKLQTRIAALEQELEASERRQKQLVTQYERVLEERTAEAERHRPEQSGSRLLSRLLGRR